MLVPLWRLVGRAAGLFRTMGGTEHWSVMLGTASGILTATV